MALSRRLAKIASLVNTDVLADIGCDHGYICIDAVTNHRANKAYACDVNEGPLESARAAVKENGLEDKIFCRLQNGVQSLPDDTTQILIAGMGGKLICEILDGLSGKLREASLILSPHKDAADVRKWLINHGYDIIREHIVKDDHFYPIIEAIPGLGAALDEQELLLGRKPVKDDDYMAFLENQKQKTEKILTQVPEGKREALEKKLGLIEKSLKP